MNADTSRHSLAKEDRPCDTVLLVIDMISDWTFPDAELLLPRARAVAPNIAALRHRCRLNGVPVVYANDNRGRWRSDFRQLVKRSMAGEGRTITEALAPDDEDYFLLKPKHSAFFCTPLDLLLQDLQADRLLLAGVASDQCIVSTAVDGRMRNYRIEVPRDCIATHTEEREQRTLSHFAEALRVETPLAADIDLRRPPA